MTSSNSSEISFETVTWHVDDDGIALLTLSRPDALNAFNVTMARELEHVFLTSAREDSVRAVIVTGEGRGFCAGMDLAVDGNVFGLDESLDPTPEEFQAAYDQGPFHDGLRDTGGRVTLAIQSLPKPVIAAINGPAVGIGATMTLSMDIRLASTSARIGFVFGRLGIVPEACSTWFLPRLVGLSTAMEWVYSACILKPEEVLRAGLVRSIHEPDDLLPVAYALAQEFVRGRSAVALGLSKQLLLHGAGATDPLAAHLAESLAMFRTSMGDGKEGVAAFLEKRDPVFQGRASEIAPIIPSRSLAGQRTDDGTNA
ncbi:crotonase/enoyl-CoA hydratase family protein [Leifsonia kafniensis]|uniref:Crotonase/enoyl-CoA hydratase family protein n=2 Tax=Leifsonia kafniensis TaxID=475957 RepID=A0ABP7KSR0_9MICO